MKDLALLLLCVIAAWALLTHKPKAHWAHAAVPEEPRQTATGLPPAWDYKHFTVTPRARYHIRAVVLSKHSFWAGGMEDGLSPFDLALGWGPMSDAAVINRLDISQSWRWYHYSWSNPPPIDPNDIISHSANNHIVPATTRVLERIRDIRMYDIVTLDGYLVDIEDPRTHWRWRTSLSREDSGGQSCELFWVTDVGVKRAGGG